MGFIFLLLVLVVGCFASLVCAVVAYVAARKRQINPWPWVIFILPPFAGLAVFALFGVLSVLSILDRLNQLESEQPF